MFSKKPDANRSDNPPASSPAPNRPRSGAAGNSTFSMIGSDVAIVGNVTASADLHIDGRIEGDIQCASLVQGETSEIVGAVDAESARLSGRVDGSISARELVVLKSAQINGDVFYDALTIEQGAQVEGRFAHRVNGQKPGASSVEGKSEEPKLSLAT